MRPHLSVSVDDSSQVGEARRAAVALSELEGFGITDSGRVALVATELGTNLVRHARGGRLLIGVPSGGTVEIVSIDKGPGMADVNACLRDGYSTGGTPGTGLGATKRLSDQFSIYSHPRHGTIVVARVSTPQSVRDSAAAQGTSSFLFGAIALPAMGETVSGDGWAFMEDGCTATAMVADGLGHGPLAAQASDKALKLFGEARGTPAQVVERAHLALMGTRGAAVAVTALDLGAGTLVFAGAGNIAGRIVSGVEDRALMSQHGTVGLQIRRMQDTPYDWPEHAIFVLHSDGIVTRWSLNDVPGLLHCDPIVIAAFLIRDHCRGRDDATVLVIRRRSS